MSPDWRRCISTLGCPELSLGHVSRLARAHGIGLVELRTLCGTTDLPRALVSEFGSPDGLARWLETAGICIAGFGSSVRLLDESDWTEICLLQPWVEAAGASHIRVFDGGSRSGSMEMDLARRRLDHWENLRMSQGHGHRIIVETHDALVDAHHLETFREQCPETRLLWDSHHTWAVGGLTPDQVWQIIGDRVDHIHVKDSHLAAGGVREYVLPGTGGFPMRDLVDLLDRRGYSGCVSLEWERMWHPGLPPLAMAIEAANAGWWT